MIIITATDTHMTFSDGGDISLTVPKEQITLRSKGDYVYFSFIAWSGEPVSVTTPKSLSFHYADVTSPSSLSGSDLYNTLSGMLAGAAPQTFTAEAAQTDFEVTNFTPSTSTKVFMSGQLVMDGWTLSGSTYTFSAAPGLGVQLVFVP